MKNQGHKGVRDMPAQRTARDKGLIATITVECYDTASGASTATPVAMT